MSSSFLGQSIEVRLHSGAIVRGKITNIDAATGSLSVLQALGDSISLSRAEIADLKMLPNDVNIQSSTPQAAPQPAAFKDPAVISYTQAAQKAVHSPALTHSPIPRAPAAMIATSSDAGSVGRQGKSAKATEKKGNKKVFDVGTSSRTHTEDEVDYEAPRNGKKNQAKNKKKNLRHVALAAQESDLEEDFDFDKALRGFDKRRIWQEIKVSVSPLAP